MFACWAQGQSQSPETAWLSRKQSEISLNKSRKEDAHEEKMLKSRVEMKGG